MLSQFRNSKRRKLYVFSERHKMHLQETNLTDLVSYNNTLKRDNVELSSSIHYNEYCTVTADFQLSTSSSAVSERLSDASCLSLVSFNSTIRRAQSSLISDFGYRFTAVYK